MSNNHSHMTEKEHNEQTGAPFLAATLFAIAIAIVIFVPVNILFWIAIALPLFAVGNYVITWSKTKTAGSLTLHDVASEYSRRKVFLGLSLLGSAVCALIIAGLLFFVDRQVFSWEYIVAVASSLFLFSIGLVLWRFSQTNAMIARAAATKAIVYTHAMKSVVYAILIQYVITQYVVGGNSLVSIIVISVVTIPYVLWLRASVLFNLLGYHPNERW